MAIAHLKSAARHFTGSKKLEVQAVIEKAEGIIAKVEKNVIPATDGMVEVNNLLTSFLATHQEEFEDLNKLLLNISKEEKEEHDAYLEKFKKHQKVRKK